MLRELLKTWLVPGTPSFLLLAIAATVPLLVGRRTRAIGATALGIVILAYLILSTPIVADALLARLTRQNPFPDAVAGDHIDAVLFLVGDSPSERAMQTIRLSRQFRPRWVIVSGPSIWADVLQLGGISPGQIIVESQAGTTYEQAINLRPVVADHHIRHIVLVASRVHMPRALAVFKTLGYDVSAAPSPVDYEIRSSGWWRLVPQVSALELSRDAIYEYCALPYYRWQGWISRASAGATTECLSQNCTTFYAAARLPLAGPR